MAATPADWVAALQRPEAYPFAVDTVELRETHISWLFFAGERVFKAKKPVDLGFLDYSTLERRRHFCEEELRLNRRLAPQTYLSVQPIVRGGDGSIRMGGAGEVLDWAVEMRLLPAERMLDRLLADGNVPSGLVEELAQRLARFHQLTESSTGVAQHGHPAAVARNLLDNFEQTRGAAGTLVPVAQHRFLERTTRAELDRRDALMQARVSEGRIRDGHGDLHAGNICLTRAGIVIYDCIEFSEALRCGDVACDLAFLVMDLDHAGAWDVGAALVRAYAVAAGDRRLSELMPLYCGYRAMVRAKVAAIRHAQMPPGPGRDEQARLARGYFDLAAVYALPPLLILVCGLPGSGKSWAARHLARFTGAQVLSSDRIRRERTQAPNPSRPTGAYGQGQYTIAGRQRVYDELLERAASALRRGHSVIVDASFARQQWRAPFLALASDEGCMFLLIERQASEARVMARMERRRQRGTSESDADYAVYQAARGDFEAPDEVPAPLRLAVSHAATPEALRQQVTERLIAQS